MTTSQRMFALYGLVAIAVVAYWPSFRALHIRWVDTDALGNTHGYVIAAICVWLIFRNRRQFGQVRLAPHPPAVFFLVVASVVWLIAYRAGLQDIHLLLLPLLIASAALAAFGPQALRAVAFPIAFFVFALPGWDQLNDLLQSLTVIAVAAFAWAIGLPAFIDGNFVHIPTGTFEIAGGCSGLHFLVVGLAIAALYGELGRETIRTRIVWLTLMAALAILSNWIRVITIIVAGHVTDMQHFLITVNHYWFGWILFGLIIGLFLAVASRWPAPNRKRGGAKFVTQQDSVAAWSPIKGWVAAAIGLFVVPSLAYASLDRIAAEPVLLRESPAVAGWQGPMPAAGAWRPRHTGASVRVLRTYRSADGGSVDVYLVLYRTQRQGAELIGYHNALFGADDDLRSLQQDLTTSQGTSWIEHELVDRQERRSVLRYQYVIGKQATTRALIAQVSYGVKSIVGSPQAVLVAYRSACDDNCDHARARIETLSSSLRAWTEQ